MMNNEPTLEQLTMACALGLIDYPSCEAQAEKNAQELFGNRQSLPDDELAIAFNTKLSHEEITEQVTALRKAQAAKRKTRKGGTARTGRRVNRASA